MGHIPELFFLEPNRVWRTYPGGKTLDEMAQVEQSKDAHFPEDWIGSTTRAVNKGREHLTEEGLSVVTYEGEKLSLQRLFEMEPLAMLGAKHYEKYGAQTQFLLKFLDSAIRLHIQCHPTIPFAQEHLNSNSGKTEAYVILATREEVAEPYIYMGFQHPPEKDEMKRIIEEQDIDALLACFEKIPIKPGDVFLVPGGYPHAIGEGVFMIEIMEPTDFAIRVEFERGGYVLPEESRFMNRGIDFAMSMFDYQRTSVEAVKEKFFSTPKILEKQDGGVEYALIDSEKTSCFSVNRLEVKGAFTKEADSFYIGIVSKGKGEVRIGEEVHELEEGMKFFVPYRSNRVEFMSKEGMEVICTSPPNLVS